MPFLLKTEPDVYAFADLQRDGTTVWDGVGNATAVMHLRGMKAGEKLVIYHTGDEKRVMGTATVVSVDAADPKVPLVTIKAGKALAKPRTLAQMKLLKMFQTSPLITIGRLGVVPLTAAQYKWIMG